jgi:hypothetical protein
MLASIGGGDNRKERPSVQKAADEAVFRPRNAVFPSN